MGKLAGIKPQLGLAIAMFLISVFMTISYSVKISGGDADRLTTFAFYVWILQIVAWFIKIMHDWWILRGKKNG